MRVENGRVEFMNDLAVKPEIQLPATIEDLSKFVLIGREKLESVRAEIRAIDKVGLAQQVREQKLQEAQLLSEAVMDAEVKLGCFLNETPKAKNGGANQYRAKSTPLSNELKSKSDVIKDLGITQKQAERFQQLAAYPEIVELAKNEARENDDIVSRSSVLNKIKEHKRAEKESKREEVRQENSEKIKSLSSPLEAQGLFQTIVIDPAWDFSEEGDNDVFGRSRPDYHVMSIEEIEALPVNKIADENCHLYLWITNRSLQKGFRLLDSWGFRYITCLTWVKPYFGIGNYFRGQTEHVLFGVKGSQPLKRKDVGTCFHAPRGERRHSAKPDEFYSLVESCSYAPYIDIFGRKERPGWSVWGENS